VNEERLHSFLLSLETEETPLLADIASYAKAHELPIARRETVSFLVSIIKLARPKRVLEVGTCSGYSAINLALAMDEGSITTIEIGANDAALARDNFSAYEKQNHPVTIELLEGDATDILPTLTGTFDFIFMDAAKGQYINWLPQVLRLLTPGGVLISDNVMQDGTVLDSRFNIERRDRTIHERMREYLYALKHTEGITSSILPLGDGVAITIKDR